MWQATSKQELFVTVVNAVNYCHNHKDIYYRCCKGSRSASGTSYYESFKRKNRKIMSKARKIY